ncbi:T9SS type A sorting domain-containing protein [Flavobacteriales bacterium]|nr:T9SS type A sorting domain-containing protein [Flavobacteriales bacterium]
MRVQNFLFIGFTFIGIVIISGTIDFNLLDNYANQPVPSFILKDNTPLTNPITDNGATLGRVLFYDKMLSIDNTISCASCHKQEFAFGDTAQISVGVNGTTGRHSMRLVNSRFALEKKFFWDERASSLEEQTTMPIQDHVEMGFSGNLGFPDIDSLRLKLANLSYYKQLFSFVYGDTIITEDRIQKSLAQFIRSIQSFDSKFDTGMAQAININADFTNFTPKENAGKRLFMDQTVTDSLGVRIAGGLSCKGCHNAPEFDINPLSRANGINRKIGGGRDFTVTRAPSLRDLLGRNGTANGPFMHTGFSSNLMSVLNHYDSIVVFPGDTGISLILSRGGNGQRLRMTAQEKNQMIAFMKTITGKNIYVDPKWSNPFTNDSTLTINQYTSIKIKEKSNIIITLYPNPAQNSIAINGIDDDYFEIYSVNGVKKLEGIYSNEINISAFSSGVYFLKVSGQTIKFVKE